MPSLHHPRLWTTTAAVICTLVGWVASTPEAIHVPSDQEQLSGTDTSLGFLDLQDVNDYLVLDGGPGNTPAYILESSAPIGSEDKRIEIDPSPTKKHDEVVIVDETIEEPTKKIKSALRKKAAQSYKDRLQYRYENAKEKLQGQSYEQPKQESTRVPRYKSRSRSFKRFRYSEDEDDGDDELFEEVDEGRQGRALSDFGSRSSRQTRQRFSSSRRSPARGSSSESSFSSRRTSGGFSRNRFKSRHEAQEDDISRESSSSDFSSLSALRKPAPKKSFSSRSQDNVETSTNPVVIKKFNKFDRPDYRKTLLNKLFQKRPDIKTRLESNKQHKQEEDDLAVGDDVDREAQPSALALSIIDDENILQNIDNEEIVLERLLTTLQVSTLYPKELSSEYIELATIRSPYTFNIEDDSKSTRFITITKSFTKSMDISPTTAFTSAPVSTHAHTPLFDINDIPAPENILASSDSYDDEDDDATNILGSTNIEYLSPVTLTTSLPTPPLKTVTETMSTVDTTIKKSILPVIYGEQSSLYTLTQTYSVTKIVTAVKTLPPKEFLEVNPIESFAEFDNLFEEAGSERRESLLPGELEFSDQDDYGLEGPSVVKVAPPSDFDLLGSKYEQQAEPQQVQDTVTPSLPQNDGLAALGITPEQLLYLQLLQNPWAAAFGGAFNKPQVITESSPVITTKPVIETSVLKVTFGAREILTTIVETKGVTTETDYILATKTVENGGFGGLTEALGALGGLQQQQEAGDPAVAPPNPFAALVPSFTVISTPVTRDTVITETLTEEFKIRFRNQETFTTITSTNLVSTQVTSFITKTQRVLPTANPFAGLLG